MLLIVLLHELAVLQRCQPVEVCGNGVQFSFPISISFNSIPTPAKHLFPFPLFSIDIPIASHSIPDYLALTTMLNNINGNSYRTIQFVDLC